jgi:hypothetical protein
VLEPSRSGDRSSGSEWLQVRWSAVSLPRASDGNGLFMLISRLVSGLGVPGYASSNIQVLAVASFANGYHALFLAGALFMLLATILTWRLVSPADTQPVSPPSPKRNEPRCSSSDGACQSQEPSMASRTQSRKDPRADRCRRI